MTSAGPNVLSFDHNLINRQTPGILGSNVDDSRLEDFPEAALRCLTRIPNLNYPTAKVDCAFHAKLDGTHDTVFLLSPPSLTPHIEGHRMGLYRDATFLADVVSRPESSDDWFTVEKNPSIVTHSSCDQRLCLVLLVFQLGHTIIDGGHIVVHTIKDINVNPRLAVCRNDYDEVRTRVTASPKPMSNILLKSVCKCMERIAPLRLAEKWDNVGLLLESPVQKSGRNNILLTIDLTSSVLSESLEKDTSIIVAYHPTIFGALKSFTLSNPLQTSLLHCAAQGISVYSPHTALDSVWGGINDWLAEGLMKSKGDGDIRALVSEKLNASSGESEGGEGRILTLKEPMAMDVLEKRIKSHLKLSQIQVAYPYADKSRSMPIQTIAICAGSGGSMLLGREADVYLTGEMLHHEVLAAVAAGKHVILCGHTNTERGYLPILAAKLHHELQANEFKDQGLGTVEVLVSQKDHHPLEFV